MAPTLLSGNSGGGGSCNNLQQSAIRGHGIGKHTGAWKVHYRAWQEQATSSSYL